MRQIGIHVATLGLVLFLVACSGEIDNGSGNGNSGGADAATPTGGGALYDALPSQLQGLFDTINAERAQRGLQLVVLRETLICAAGVHSDDVGPISSCSHTGSDGSSPGNRVDGCGGGGWSGEIIACGQGTPRSAVDAWINSPGHNAIMFGSSKRQIGVAVTNNFWTAIFDD